MIQSLGKLHNKLSHNVKPVGILRLTQGGMAGTGKSHRQDKGTCWFIRLWRGVVSGSFSTTRDGI